MNFKELSQIINEVTITPKFLRNGFHSNNSMLIYPRQLRTKINRANKTYDLMMAAIRKNDNESAKRLRNSHIKQLQKLNIKQLGGKAPYKIVNSLLKGLKI